jgi:hypothetical protein
MSSESIHKIIVRGFILSGITNIAGVGLFSKLFTNSTIPAFDPVVMSNFGLLMIMVWGAAYIAVAPVYDKVKWLVAVFAIEKLIYGVVWVHWLLHHSLSDVFQEDLLAGIFYSVYGINDWCFFIFFSFVFLRLWKKR